MESAKELAEGRESVRQLVEYTYEDLKTITDGFDDEKNYIGETQYGKLFHGKVQLGYQTEHVIVKMLIVDSSMRSNLGIQLSRLENEKKLLTDPKYSHQNLPKLIGYCVQNEHLGSVYELRPLDTVDNLITKDDFKWMNRIKVALEFARLLEFFYDQQIKLRNVDAHHLVVDQAFNPKLLDFSMSAGGVFGRSISLKYLGLGSFGYVDPHMCMLGDDSQCDVYSFGLILLALISKRPVLNLKEKATLGQKVQIWYWAECEYNSLEGSEHRSLVHKSLEADPLYNRRDGGEITKLALQCGVIEDMNNKRPTIRQVVSRLNDLNAVQHCLLLDIPLED